MVVFVKPEEVSLVSPYQTVNNKSCIFGYDDLSIVGVVVRYGDIQVMSSIMMC